MKIIALIADDGKPDGWPEWYTAEKFNATPDECRAQMDGMVQRFNATLRPGEIPRRLLSVQLNEIEPDGAFTMGRKAYHAGKEMADNYWPAEHALHKEWNDGWLDACDEDNDEEE